MQVLWVGKEDVSASWVHEKSLPTAVIREFEEGVEMEVSVEKTSRCSQVSFTASVEAKDATLDGQTKTPKLSRWISPSNSGYIYYIKAYT